MFLEVKYSYLVYTYKKFVFLAQAQLFTCNRNTNLIRNNFGSFFKTKNKLELKITGPKNKKKKFN